MKIPFTLDAWLKDKSQKVETRDGRPVKIISFELTDTNDCPIAAQFRLCAGTPVVYLFDENGEYRGEGASDYDLFIITPEPELTSWQTFISGCLQKYGLLDCGAADRIAKECSAELLKLARNEIVKSGYAIVESEHYLEEGRKSYERGKAESLKDLPRWRKEQGEMELVGYGIIGGGVASQENPRVYLNGHSIDLYSLEKLPGFNE